MQRHLAELAAGEVPSLIAGRDPELDSFLKSLKTAWQKGEVRATHVLRPKPPRDWRTRADPFEVAWPLVRRWLEAEPDRTAKEIFQRLQLNHPGQFSDGQVRTLQRRVQNWRRLEARRLILGHPSSANSGHDFADVTG